MVDSSGISEDKKEEFKEVFQNIWQSLYKYPNYEVIEEEYFFEMPKGYLLTKLLYFTSGNIFLNYNQLLFSEFDNDAIYTGTCTPFSKKMFLTIDGRILPCERIEHDFEVGHVNDNFVELDYKYIAEKHNYYTSKCSDQCVSCASNAFCSQCVFHIDDIRSKSSHCSSFCTQKNYDKEKEQLMDFLRQHPNYYDKRLKWDI